MNQQISFIEWVTASLQLIESADVSVHIRRRSENLLEALLSSVIEIDDWCQGVRSFALLAVDDGVEGSEVERFCVEYSSQIGVLEVFLMSSSSLDDRTSEVLASHRVRSVRIASEKGYTQPSPKAVANFAGFLLGERRIGEFVERLGLSQQSVTEAEQSQEAGSLLRSAYSVLISLYLSESEILHKSKGGRTVVEASQSGVESAMSVGYAVKDYPLDGGWTSVVIPDRSNLERGLSLAAAVYGASLRAEQIGSDGQLARVIARISRRFFSYYLAWADGRHHVLPHEELREEFAKFVGAPYISILSSQLPDLMPPEQLALLDMLRMVRARDATGDLLGSLDSMVPKVQEECLNTLASLGALEDPSQLEPFIRSRRESLRDAALRVIGRMRSDEAAKYLIQLINSHTVPLSESVLRAIANTRSVLALGSLIVFSASREEAEIPVLSAVESCLDSLDLDDVRRDGPRYVPIDVLNRYVSFLFEAADHAAKRLALKLIGAFQLSAGAEYVEQALQGESLVDRLNAIKVVAIFPADRLVRIMTDSVANLPDSYESQRTLEWMTANIDVHFRRDGPAGRIVSVSDMDLPTAAVESLSKAGTELAAVCLDELSAPNRAAASDVRSDREEPDWRSVPLLNSIFKCPSGLTVWVTHVTRERHANDVALAVLIHDNQFEGSQDVREAASMLSGGLSMTQGTEAEILEDVVFPCLRGEQPRFPASAGMGEFVRTNVEDGRTVTQTREVLPRIGMPKEAE